MWPVATGLSLLCSIKCDVYVTIGGYHSLAVDENGGVWSWGRGEWGRLGKLHSLPSCASFALHNHFDSIWMAAPRLIPSHSSFVAHVSGFGDSSDVLEPLKMDEMCEAMKPTIARAGEAHSACVGKFAVEMVDNGLSLTQSSACVTTA